MGEVEINRIYKHYKGDLYIVEDIIYHSETCEKMIAYYNMFFDEVNKNGQKYRFELYEVKSVKD